MSDSVTDSVPTPPPVPPSIFLVGPMGSGKSAVGRLLARRRRQRFVDSDTEIERRTGVDIPFIFEREGEIGFRERERQVIDELTQWPGIVLATGGGAILRPENQQHLSSRGIVVYLETSVADQVVRTQRARNRPLLFGTDPAIRLAELYAIRDPIYRALARVTVSTDRRKVPAVVAAIEAGLAALDGRET
jgi:shikimate kinase